ncbi:uncharacterized protein LOC105840572 [Monomorium pharaonis]|uniref:uncharacterized protein LOC105840572 n=1 Tax=Monomorium pharaonis TaxID=307658 RepID=UPI00063FC6AD|nr:uncharacterized protein LOC105840572 [Monomorium pharaonis]XP_028049386.1 uncharacterized protein LOC105840572 [Monomorium pharaonis]
MTADIWSSHSRRFIGVTVYWITLKHTENRIKMNISLWKQCSFEGIVSPLLPPHQRCASHTLHLVATIDILSDINLMENINLLYNDVINKCTCLWNLTRSPKKHEIMFEALREALNRPIATRWTLFNCLKQLIKFKDKPWILSVQLDIADSFTTSDFIFIEEYIKCTEPIAEALDIL